VLTPRKAREAVIGETPERRATSDKVGRPVVREPVRVMVVVVLLARAEIGH
jgi:hypothetical protein